MNKLSMTGVAAGHKVQTIYLGFKSLNQSSGSGLFVG